MSEVSLYIEVPLHDISIFGFRTHLDSGQTADDDVVILKRVSFNLTYFSPFTGTNLVMLQGYLAHKKTPIPLGPH
jgi:hypothetical protein